MRLGLCNVSTLTLGSAFVARSSLGSTSAPSPTSTLEPTDLGKDREQVRILSSFDLGDAAVKTCRCA